METSISMSDLWGIRYSDARLSDIAFLNGRALGNFYSRAARGRRADRSDRSLDRLLRNAAEHRSLGVVKGSPDPAAPGGVPYGEPRRAPQRVPIHELVARVVARRAVQIEEALCPDRSRHRGEPKQVLLVVPSIHIALGFGGDVGFDHVVERDRRSSRGAVDLLQLSQTRGLGTA